MYSLFQVERKAIPNSVGDMQEFKVVCLLVTLQKGDVWGECKINTRMSEGVDMISESEQAW